jgi:hypothetical protein
MPTFPTQITAGVPYSPVATRKIYFVPTIAVPATPTRAELTAGSDLSLVIVGMTGFDQPVTFLTASPLGSPFDVKVSGRITPSDSSIDCLVSKSGTDVRTVLPRGTSGYFTAMWEGDIPTTGKMDVYPISVGSQSKAVDTTAIQIVTISLAITGAIQENVAIPANP